MNKKLCIFYFAILVVVQAQTDTCCRNYQIQVTGQGRASGQPDVAILDISFSENGLTSAEAVKKLSAKVNQALAVLKANGYGNDAYETGSLSVYAEYDYSANPARETGQRAQQTITIRVRGLDEKGQKVATLIDALAKINGLNINNVSFDIFDKTPLQTQARAAAYKDAKAKAEDYAQFAGVSVGRVLTIDDFSYVDAPPVPLERAKVAFAVASSDSVGTAVPVGEQEISYSTTVTFDLR